MPKAEILELEKVTIRQLFEGGQTHEPSEKALRARAHQGILFFLESVGNAQYYDKDLSIIRVNAARKCNGPGVKWEDIRDCLKKADLTPERLREQLRSGASLADATDALAAELSARLEKH